MGLYMDDFLALLSFSIFPFLSCLVFSLIVAPVGAAHYMRNELMMGIALPPVGSALISLSIIMGLHIEHPLEIIAVTFLGMFATTFFLTNRARHKKVSHRKKEIYLAATWSLGGILTYIFAAVSSEVGTHIKPMITGEVLSISMSSFIIILVSSGLILFFCYHYRGFFLSYLIDEIQLRLQGEYYKKTYLWFRLLSALVITMSVVFVGPLLTSAWLIFPALWAEHFGKNIRAYFVLSLLINFGGTLTGFLLALLLDLPPAMICSLMVFVVGLAAYLIQKIKYSANTT